MGSIPTRAPEPAFQARAFQALHEVAMAAGGVLEPVELARVTIDHARDILEADAASLFLYEAAEGLLRRIITNNDRLTREVFTTVQPGSGLVGLAFSTAKPMAIDDYASSPAARPEIMAQGVASAIAVPLLLRDRPVGVLVVVSSLRREWQEGEIELLKLFAAQVSPAIEAARLAHERGIQATRFHVLHELAVAAGGVVDLGRLAQLTVDRTRDLVGGWSATLVWFGEEGARVLADNHPQVLPSVDLAAGRGMTGQVLVTGEMVIVDDYPAWEHAFDWAVEAGVGSMVGVPLKVQDISVGCLLVRSRERSFFRDERREMLPLLAAQVGPALQAAWLSGEREKQAELFRGLHDLAVAASGVLEPAELARVASEHCRGLLEVDGTVIVLHDPQKHLLEPLHATTEESLDRPILPGEGAIGRSFSERRFLAIDDYASWDGRLAGPISKGLAAGLSVPLIAGDEAVGVVGVWKDQPHHWTDREVQVLSLVALQVGPALQTARVAKEREAQAETLRSLHELAMAAHGVVEPEVLAALAVEKACQLINGSSAVVNWWEGSEGGLRVLSDNLAGLEMGLHQSSASGANGLAFTIRQPVAIHDYANWDRAHPQAVALGVKSVVAVPLMAQDRPVGSLAVRSNSLRTFNQAEIQLLSLIAATLGPSLEAAKLNARLATSERRLRLIFDTAPLVIARCDLEGHPLEVNAAVLDVFGYPPEEIRGMSPADLVGDPGPTDFGRFAALLTGQIDHFQTDQLYRRKDGGVFWGHTIMSLVRDAEGRPDYYYAIVEDATERLGAAAAAEEQSKTLLALHEVAKAAAGVLEPGQLARIATERARDLLNATGGSLCWWDEERHGFRFLADTEVGEDSDRVYQRSEIGAQGVAFETGEALVIEDYPNWPGHVPSEVTRVRSALVVPLQVRQRRVGSLAVSYSTPQTFTPDRVQLLGLLAAEVAPSMEAARLHEDLVASTRSIRAIFETAPVGIARLDVNLRILGLNRRAEELTGHRSADLVGRPVALSLIGGQDLGAMVTALLGGDGPQLRFERSIRRRRGGSFLADLTLTVVRNADGEAEFLYAMFDDITERKRSEEALRDSEGRKTSIVQSALDCIVAADASGRIVEFNPAAERTFGLRRADVLGQVLWDTIIPADLLERHLKAMAAVAGSAGQYPGRRMETMAQHRDGTRFPIELSVATFQQGGETMYSASIRDLSERAAVESMRLENEAKSRFVAAMSHELRTPLNSILGFSQLLGSSGIGELNDRQQRYVGHIESSGRHLLALINDVLDLSKVAAGQMEVELEPVELVPLIEEAINQVRPLADVKPIELLLDPCPVIWIRADRRRFLQVLLNLLSNAIKFTPSGGMVRVKAVRSGRSAEIAVIDTGVGIPDGEHERIFEEFTQVDHRSLPNVEGTGLGLALTRRLLQLMRGSIQVQSVVGEGSTFTVTVPRIAAGKVSESRPLLLVVHGATEDPNLLLQLESGAYRVMATGTVREATVIARRRRLSAVILGESVSDSDESWLREALKDHPRTQTLPILSGSVALHPGVLIP